MNNNNNKQLGEVHIRVVFPYRHDDVDDIVRSPPSKTKAESDHCFKINVHEVLRAGVRDLPLTVFTEFSQGDGRRLWRMEKRRRQLII